MKNLLFLISLTLYVISVSSCDLRKSEIESVEKETVNVGLLDDQDYEEVFIDDGAIQCEKTGVSLAQTSARLVSAGIKVADSYCGTITRVMVASQCGLKNANVHVHSIPSHRVKSARGLGYEPMSSLKHYGNKEIDMHDCPDVNAKGG